MKAEQETRDSKIAFAQCKNLFKSLRFHHGIRADNNDEQMALLL